MNKVQKVAIFVLGWSVFFLMEIKDKRIYTTMTLPEVLSYWLVLWTVTAILAVVTGVVSGVTSQYRSRKA